MQGERAVAKAQNNSAGRAKRARNVAELAEYPALSLLITRACHSYTSARVCSVLNP